MWFRRWYITWRDQYPQSNVDVGGRVLTVSNKHAMVTRVFPRDVDQKFMERCYVSEMNF